MNPLNPMKLAMMGSIGDAQFVDAIPLYHEMGVDEIDLFAKDVTEDVKALVGTARDLGIPVSSLSPRWGWLMRSLQDPAEIDRLLSFIEHAPTLGTQRIMLSCSFAKPATETERQAHFEQVVGIYRTVARAAEAAGIDLCTHTTTRPGILFGSVEGIDAFLKAVASPRNKLLLCCGCVSVAGWDVPQLIHHWRDAIGAVHLFNPLGNWDRYDEMRFDRGQLDLWAALRALQEIGYDKVLVPHEYPSFGGPCGVPISHGWVIGYLIAMLQILRGQQT